MSLVYPTKLKQLFQLGVYGGHSGIRIGFGYLIGIGATMVNGVIGSIMAGGKIMDGMIFSQMFTVLL